MDWFPMTYLQANEQFISVPRAIFVQIAIITALTILALPCTILATMGVQYFAGAPLFLAGALSVTVAGVFMLLALVWARRDLARNG